MKGKRKRQMMAMKKKKWSKFIEQELTIAKNMFAQDIPPSQIADILGKSRSAVTRRLCKRTALKKQGRPITVTEQKVDKVEKRLDEMIVKANGETPVTIGMAKRSCRLECNDKTLLNKLHQRGVYLRPMREKPTLTEQDVKDRYAFAKKYKDKPTSFWRQHIHLHSDCKMFKVCLSQSSRGVAKGARVKGVYRKRGQGLATGYTKPPKKAKFNTGAKSAWVIAGVGQKKVLVWHYLKDWSPLERRYSRRVLQRSNRQGFAQGLPASQDL